MLVADIIYDVSVDLNDVDHVRWPESMLLSYLREIMPSVSRQLKDLFTETYVVQVEPGAGWQEACDCSRVVRILGESTSDGTITRYLTRASDDERNVWPGAVNSRCRVSPSDYVMTSYMLSRTEDGRFRIIPPVPSGVTKYVVIECFNVSTELGGSVPDEVVAMVKQWMLYRALSIDSELNPTIVELANNHRQTYFSLMEQARLERELEKRDGDIRTVQDSSSG